MKVQSGQRVRIAGAGTIEVEARLGTGADRLVMVTVADGVARRIEASSQGLWRLDVSRDAEIVVGVREGEDPATVAGGFALKWPGTDIEIDTLDKDHRAVIIGNVYSRQGDRMLKVSGEGYAYGLEAYGRRNRIDLDAIIPKAPPPTNDGGLQPWQRQPEHRDGDRRPRGRHDAVAQGSGVCVAAGVVVTNHHVIENGRTFAVMHEGSTADARVITSDEFHDLAILRHDPIPGLMPVAFRDAAETYLSEELLAAGYPLAQLLGDDLKISSGNISGLKGTDSDVSRLQFTAPIASGSSGGAIVDVGGRLIGIVAAALSHDLMRANGGTSENVNFAIKASVVREMLISCGIEAPALQPATSLARPELSRRIRSHVVAVSSR